MSGPDVHPAVRMRHWLLNKASDDTPRQKHARPFPSRKLLSRGLFDNAKVRVLDSQTMRNSVRVATVIAAVLLVTTAIVAGQAVGSASGVSGPAKLNPKADINAAGFPPPYWAYPVNLPDYVAPPDKGEKMRVPNSNVTYTLTQIRDFFSPPDWHPEDHPAMPPIIGTGRKPQVWACGYCHLPTGWGKPENANVSNLPEPYFMQTVADFKNGTRRGTVPDILPHSGMVAAIMPTTDAEVLAPIVGTGEGMEPIGQRIIEVPDDPILTTLRDWRIGFTTYVPPGSLKKGEALVTTGGGKTVQCTICHGSDLRGIGPVPPIAGRSAIYTFRQLYDFKDGARHGAWSAMMKPVVQNLTLDDMIAITAYTSSRMP
jgi:cytochrome c553